MPVTNAARVMLASLIAGQAIATLAIDFNRTHATNPKWPGHARFHLVWQNLNIALFAVIELALLWWTGPLSVERFYLVAGMAAIPLLAFLAAQACHKLYGGTLHDQNGIQPLRLHFGGRLLQLDLNFAAICIACVFLFVTVLVA